MTLRKGLFQLFLIVFFLALCWGGFFLVKSTLQLPFRATNDALHKEGAIITLDSLIPAGTYIEEKTTIGEVARIRFSDKSSGAQRVMDGLFKQVPPEYRLIGNLVLFLFWVLCYLTFLRVFTFLGYGRALRTSLLLAGVTYYFMPDPMSGAMDDFFFLGFPILIIIIRFYMVRKKRKKLAES